MNKKIYGEEEDVCLAVAGNDLLEEDNKIVITDEKIEIEFDYPLGKTVRFSYNKKGGWKKNDIIKKIREGYRRIYKEEDEVVGKTGNIKGMWNRGFSNGPYEIYGHHVGDLVIEMVSYDTKKKLVLLSIGS